MSVTRDSKRHISPAADDKTINQSTQETEMEIAGACACARGGGLIWLPTGK